MDWELLRTISSWATVVFTISLGIPQLIKLLIEKKTGKVSFASFWTLHIGVMMWVIYGSISSKESPYGLWNVIVADGISLLISTAMVWFLYWYKEGITKKQKLQVAIALSTLLAITISIILMWAIDENARISSNAAVVFSLIAPAFTTFAFSPQLYVSIKSKNWKGVSPWVYVMFTINNFFWILFWISFIVIQNNNGASYTDIIGALIWQSISFVLYFYQLSATLYYNSKMYESKQKATIY